jgi:hypothetical protein
MSTLSKVVVIDKIEVLEDHTLQIRQATRILEDGVELSSSFHRWVLSPGDDVSTQDPKVKAIATAVWTTEVIAAYEAAAQANTIK